MFPEDLKNQLKNTHAFVVTPFEKGDRGRLDANALERNAGFLIEHGVKVLSIGGGTGEVNALSNSELVTLTRTAFDMARSGPLVIPTLPENLGAALELAPAYERMGARGRPGNGALYSQRSTGQPGGCSEPLQDACRRLGSGINAI